MNSEDIEGIQSDLRALRKLYGLLQTNGHGFQDESSDLDEKARLLLKNLLDGAAERVFEAHSEIMSAHLKETLKQRPSILANVSQISPTVVQSTKGPSPEKVALSNKDERITMVMPSISKLAATIQHRPGLEQSTPSFSASTLENRRKKRCRVCRQSSVKQLKSTEESTIPNNETQNPSKDIISLQHQLYNLPTNFHFGNNWSDKGLGFGNKAINNSARSVERQRQRRNLSEFKRNPYDPACSLKNAATTGVVQSGATHNFTAEIVEEDGHIDKEASDVIEQIESCIAALQQVVLLANQVGSQDKKLTPQIGFRANSVLALEPANIELKEMKFPNQSVNGASRPPPSSGVIRKVEQNKGVSSEYDMLNQSVPGQIVKAILEKIESLRWVASQNDYMPSQGTSFVQGLRVPLDRNKMSNGALPVPAKSLSQINDENFDRNLMPQTETMKKVGTSQPSVSSVGSTGFMGHDRRILTTARPTTRSGKGLPGQTHMRRNLLDHKYNQAVTSPISYEHQADQEQGLVQKKNSCVGPRRVISPYQVESDGTSSSLRTSSSWTSEQASMSRSSGSEEYSVTGQTPSEHYMSPSTGSESDIYSLPGKTRVRYAGPTSTSESVPSTTRAHQVGSTGSSESMGYLPSDQASTHHRIDTTYRTLGSTSTSRRMGPRKNSSWTKPEKQVGRLRKLKDKLAIIFHHHHHHHHHHHDDNQYDRQAKINRGTSLRKNKAGSVLNQRSKDEAYGEQAAEKVRKSVVRNVADKNQRGHLRTLVEGLLNHLRHSKKSNPSKGGIGRMENGQHMRKKAVKKLDWCEMLRRHRGGIKVPNRQRTKLGLGAKRPLQVKALPKIR